MKINFRPQKLMNNLVLENKTEEGIRRIISTPKRTIDMTISSLKSYPKEYYVSSFNAYDNKSNLVKAMKRTIDSNNHFSTEISRPSKKNNIK